MLIVLPTLVTHSWFLHSHYFISNGVCSHSVAQFAQQLFNHVFYINQTRRRGPGVRLPRRQHRGAGLLLNWIRALFRCLQVARRTSGAAVMGCVCRRTSYVTKRRTAKTEVTRPIVKLVRGGIWLFSGISLCWSSLLTFAFGHLHTKQPTSEFW